MGSLVLQTQIPTISYHPLLLPPVINLAPLISSRITLPQFSNDQITAVLSSMRYIEPNRPSSNWTLVRSVGRAAADFFTPIKESLQTAVANQSAEMLSSVSLHPVTLAVKSSLLALAYRQHLNMADGGTGTLRKILLGAAAVNTIHTGFFSPESSISLFKLSLAGLLITLKAMG